MSGFFAILIKEFAHVRRQRSTSFFAIIVPALQLIIFGFAANVTVRNIPTVVLDLDGRRESRELIAALENTRVLRVIESVIGYEAFSREITSGRARLGLVIPPDYSERLLRGEQASVQALIDGSDAQVASAASSAVGLLITQLSFQRARRFGEALQLAPSRDQSGALALPIEVRTRLLYNPDLEDSHFFVPGLIAIILQTVLAFLTSFSIVKERESGTLEQLFVTPVSPAALLLGKLVPYALLAAVELVIILVLMVHLFGVPIHGSMSLLFGSCMLFVMTVLGLGILISTLARTQLQAMQASLLFMLPSVLLSGFVFPRAEMPAPLQFISLGIPVTHMVEIMRGVVLRGADLTDVAPWIFGLASCCTIIVLLALLRFNKQLD